MTSDSISFKRYSAQAWLLAIGVSLIPAGTRLEWVPAIYGGFFTVAIALALWWIRKVTRPRARLHSAVILLWLWNAALFLSLLPVYIEPTLNRAFAEEIGMDMVDALRFALACSAAVTLVFLYAARLPEGVAAGPRFFARALCAGTPIALGALALAGHAYVPLFRTTWREIGADLPAPTLLLQAGEPYLVILPLLALAVGAYAWAKPRDAHIEWAYDGLLALLFLGGVLASFGAFAAYLVRYPGCGGPI